MGQIPGFLTVFQPIIYGRDIGGFPRPGKQGRLKSQDALKWGHTCRVFVYGILCIFRPHEVTTPILLMTVAVRTKKTSDFLVQAFNLPVDLGVVPRS